MVDIISDLSSSVRQLLEEASELVDSAAKEGIVLRAFGSAAVYLHCPKYSRVLAAFGRKINDLDFVGYANQKRQLLSFFSARSYSFDKYFSIVASGDRSLFVSSAEKPKIEVSFDRLSFCHRIDLESRLETDYPTIPLAELLLSKLQVVEANEKDLQDLCTLILEHPLGTKDQETINIDRFVGPLARDWGFFHTVMLNIKKAESFLPRGPLTLNEVNDALDKLNQLRDAARSCRKSLRWRLRALIGPRLRWYDEVTEAPSAL